MVGDKVLLTYQGQNIGTVTIDSKWTPNKPLECLKCYGTSSLEHPAVQMVAMERGKYYIGEWRCRRASSGGSCRDGGQLVVAAIPCPCVVVCFPSGAAPHTLLLLTSTRC